MEHLSEERLLAVADGELEHDHVAACDECSRAVAELRAARGALRAAPMLELPREEVRDLVAALPDRTRERRLRGWPRLVVIAAPVAAAAVAIAVVGTGADDERLADDAGADATMALTEPAQQEDARSAAPPQLEGAPQAAASCPPPDASRQTPVATVDGPPQEVVALLQRNGIDAVLCEDGAVEVPGLQVEATLEALEAREPGGVEVRSSR